MGKTYTKRGEFHCAVKTSGEIKNGLFTNIRLKSLGQRGGDGNGYGRRDQQPEPQANQPFSFLAHPAGTSTLRAMDRGTDYSYRSASMGSWRAAFRAG